MRLDPAQLLQEHFGLTQFRPGQREVIDALLENDAALAVFPTGGGKSLCYQLPALMLEGVTIVVSPLIALMKDQIDFLRSRGIPAARLDSSLSTEEARAVSEQMRSGELKLLYVAPERFNNERFTSSLQRTRIALFAVDEAHCISEWGHNFRPDYLKLAAAAHELGVERVLALTATATPTVVEAICEGFDIPHECAIVTGFYRHNLRLATTPVTATQRDGLLLKRMQSRTPGAAIVYVTLQKTAERVARLLAEAGLPARAYHAGLKPEERSNTQEWWMNADSHIVVATIAFGMGIDKANVRYVYHYNLPKGLESYSQEIGRAGRDGQPSTVELLACPDDVPTLENFVFGDTPTTSALHALVEELLSAGESFEVSEQELSNRHDLRPLVLRTAITYLELLGVLKQGTPFYAGYEIKPLLPLPEIIAGFQGEAARFVEELFAYAKQGRIWYALNPEDAAKALNVERKRVVRALEVMEEHGCVQLKAADVRQRYSRLRPGEDVAALVNELAQRFHRREDAEISRIGQVLELIEHEGCQTNALVGYFGEERAEPCGHCTFCRTGKASRLPPARALPPLPGGLDTDELQALRQSHPTALGEARQVARFLCGLSGPALTKAKLSRHALFGALEEWRFSEVLAWCEGLA
ncbi:MAG: ATP-dependent helicase RecQ [Abditibacteriota bacterium]|nr:ATP-dependent helicase RecQ [Abditibacteriota bacterium]